MKQSSVLLAWFFGLAIVGSTVSAHAEKVRPKDSVVTGVNVRAEAASDSASLGVMRPGETLPYDGSVPGVVLPARAHGAPHAHKRAGQAGEHY